MCPTMHSLSVILTRQTRSQIFCQKIKVIQESLFLSFLFWFWQNHLSPDKTKYRDEKTNDLFLQMFVWRTVIDKLEISLVKTLAFVLDWFKCACFLFWPYGWNSWSCVISWCWWRAQGLQRGWVRDCPSVCWNKWQAPGKPEAQPPAGTSFRALCRRVEAGKKDRKEEGKL